MQQLFVMSHSKDRKSNEKKESTDCADECFCKIKLALELIVREIKKVNFRITKTITKFFISRNSRNYLSSKNQVDTAIKNLSMKDQCPYAPKPDDKKEFAKSVRKNSSVCHVIIGELKKQRVEIDEMLQLFKESTRVFSKMEATLSQQREKVPNVL